jgi:hypothetical protein
MGKASRCFLLAMMVMVSAAGSAFAGEDEDEDTFEQKVIKKILRGLGADVGQGRIEYRERSPIVIPPSRDLPPPQSADAVQTPNWPKDPDQQPKKKSESKSIRSDSIARHNTERATISPQELENGRVAGAGRVTEPNKSPMDESSEYGGGRPLPPSKLGTKKLFGWFGSKEEQAPFTGEPERNSLTQPPPGYQTPSPSYPYGLAGSAPPTVQQMPEIKDPATK